MYEWRAKEIAGPHSYFQKATDGFEEWINTRCQRARNKSLKRRWAEILRGPQPFTAEELRIVKAHKRFRWRIVGVAKNRKIKFEVHNGSGMTLRYLSIGIDNKDATLGGGTELPVSSVRPGQTKIIEIDCYKSMVPPEDIVAFDYPAPGPEDRDRYSEFAV